jgi:hypothetical protein
VSTKKDEKPSSKKDDKVRMMNSVIRTTTTFDQRSLYLP